MISGFDHVKITINTNRESHPGRIPDYCFENSRVVLILGDSIERNGECGRAECDVQAR